MKLQRAARNGKPIDFRIETIPERIRHKVGGIVINEPDRYIIVINDRTATWRAFGHELAHVFCGHFDENGSKKIAEKEREADRKAFRYYALWKLGLLH